MLPHKVVQLSLNGFLSQCEALSDTSREVMYYECLGMLYGIRDMVYKRAQDGWVSHQEYRRLVGFLKDWGADGNDGDPLRLTIADKAQETLCIILPQDIASASFNRFMRAGAWSRPRLHRP